MFNWRAAGQTKRIPTVIGILTGTLCGSALIRTKENSKSTLFIDSREKVHPKIFSSAEVAEHDSLETGVWVTYKDNVYDITDFINSHPGGVDKILMPAGGALEPYWSVYPVHKTNTILDLLEKYHIGRLDEDSTTEHETVLDDPFQNDPVRHPALLATVENPYEGEIPTRLLWDYYITPNELHYVRNHMPVPAIDEKDYQLTLSGKGVRDVSLSIKNLKHKFKKHTVVATLHCAGNRQTDMSKVKAILGVPSGSGMISTAQWGGALLKDILEDAGLDDEAIESLGIEHVQFEALDFDVTGTSYGVSIPISKAMDRKGDVLLAYEMNGEDLPLDHGYPVRVIVPGVAACRSVKWLGKIIVSDKESESFWQQNKYRGFPPNTDTKSSEFNLSPSIQEFPVTSVVCHPKENQSFSRQNDECIPMKGYAWSGGGRSIIRVDISVDGGKTWTVANFKRQEQPRGRQWAWTFWECDVTIPVGVNKLEVVCKAVDSSYNVQPENVLPIWNPNGYLMTSWSRVNVLVED